MATTLSAEDITRNPAFHLYDLDLQKGLLDFLGVTPDTFRLSAFLDNRIAFTDSKLSRLDIDAVIAACRQLPPRPVVTNFIFHSSFCCSSLLARSLQVERLTLVLREPWVLRRLADIKREQLGRGEDWGKRGAALVDMALTLLGKTWTDSQSILIKPTNVANNLAAEMLAARPEARGVLLYSDLESFLISNLKKSGETRQKIPVLARLFSLDAGTAAAFDGVPVDRLTALQAAAAVWYLQMFAFGKLLADRGDGRLASLDSARLLKAPEETLAAVTRHYGYPVSADEIAAIVAGPTWHTHAKDPFSGYDRQTRETENQQVAGLHSEEIRNTLLWAEKLLARQPLEFPLAAGLLPANA